MTARTRVLIRASVLAQIASGLAESATGRYWLTSAAGLKLKPHDVRDWSLSGATWI